MCHHGKCEEGDAHQHFPTRPGPYHSPPFHGRPFCGPPHPCYGMCHPAPPQWCQQDHPGHHLRWAGPHQNHHCGPADPWSFAFGGPCVGRGFGKREPCGKGRCGGRFMEGQRGGCEETVATEQPAQAAAHGPTTVWIIIKPGSTCNITINGSGRVQLSTNEAKGLDVINSTDEPHTVLVEEGTEVGTETEEASKRVPNNTQGTQVPAAKAADAAEAVEPAQPADEKAAQEVEKAPGREVGAGEAEVVGETPIQEAKTPEIVPPKEERLEAAKETSAPAATEGDSQPPSAPNKTNNGDSGVILSDLATGLQPVPSGHSDVGTETMEPPFTLSNTLLNKLKK